LKFLLVRIYLVLKKKDTNNIHDVLLAFVTTVVTLVPVSQAKPSQAKPSQAKPSQAKVLTGGGDLRKAQVDVPLSVSHTCV